MTYSVLKIKCEECKANIPAYKDGIVDILTDYEITCPKCNKQTIFRGKPASLEAKAPKGATPILSLEKEMAC